MPDTPLPAAEAERIIARAIELDQDGPRVSLERLREIADEVGIAPHALEAAIREHADTVRARLARADDGRRRVRAVHTTPVPPDPGKASLRTRLADRVRKLDEWITAGALSVGTFGGWLSGNGYRAGVGGGSETPAVLVVVTALSLAIVALQADRRSRKPWALQQFVLWFSYGYAWTIGYGRFWEDVFSISWAGFGGAMLLGEIWRRLSARERERTSQEPER